VTRRLARRVAEVYTERVMGAELRERRPLFDLVRARCGRAPGAAFDEVEALRAEVERLGRLVEETARRLDQPGCHDNVPGCGEIRGPLTRTVTAWFSSER
jgi:hypothetical protein